MCQISVSVIIPFYNHIDWLIEAVESVLGQSMQNYEIIVINDGSDEDMSDFLSKYGEYIVYVFKENGGPATARNLGIEQARGKYIAFLDSDDIWLPDKLKIQYEKMEKSNCQWSYCGYRTFGAEKNVLHSMTRKDDDEIQRYNSPYIATPCVMIRRELLLQHPDFRFNVNMRYGQDSYMWLKINADNSILAIHECLVNVRMHGNNAAKRARVQLQTRGYIWKCRKKENLVEGFNLTLLYRIASNLCIFGNAIVSFLTKLQLPERILEFISKGLFIIPWILFKIDRKIKL